MLYLNRQPFHEMEFDLLNYDDKLSFKLNYTLRQHMVDYKINEFKAIYWKQIQKADYNYKIILVHESRINNYNKKEIANMIK